MDQLVAQNKGMNFSPAKHAKRSLIGTLYGKLFSKGRPVV